MNFVANKDEAEKEAEDLKTKPQFEESSKHVKQTETVHDYFKRKMAERAERLKLAGMTLDYRLWLIDFNLDYNLDFRL